MPDARADIDAANVAALVIRGIQEGSRF